MLKRGFSNGEIEELGQASSGEEVFTLEIDDHVSKTFIQRR